MNLTPAPQSSVFPDDRRRHLRQRVSSIVYVSLDDGNGGILLTLGLGGLSFQAAAGLHPDKDVIVDFTLFETNEKISVAGHLVWLGPTRKEAGLCFKDLARSTEQSIARWMAKVETTTDSTESTVAQPINPVPAVSETPLPPPRASVASISQSDLTSNSPSSRTPLPSDLLLGNAPRKRPLTKPSAALAFDTLFQSPIPTQDLHAKEDWVASTMDPIAERPEPLEAISQLHLASPSDSPRDFARSDQMSPNLPLADAARVSPGHSSPWDSPDLNAEFVWRSLIQILSSLQGKRRRQVLIVSTLAACLGTLVLIAASLGMRSGTNGPSASSESGLSVSPAVAGVGSGVAAVPRRKGQSWLASVESIFVGADDRGALDSSTLGIAVWTDTKSGFYYCPDSPYFGKLSSGSLVTQGDALQSGYQPKLGRYCQ